MTYRHVFTKQTIVDIPGSVHGLGTARLISEVFITAPEPGRWHSYEIQINPQTLDVRIQFCYTLCDAVERRPLPRTPGKWIVIGLRALRRCPRLAWIPRLLLGELTLQTQVIWEPPLTGVILLHARSSSTEPAPLSP